MSCESNIKSSSSNCKCSNLRRIPKHPTDPYGLIDDVMRKYFCRRAKQGSSCSLFSIPNKSDQSMDKRLQYWTRILEDRKRLACRIRKVTGKRISHILYNQLEDHRNIQNVKRIIDISERLDPVRLSLRKAAVLKKTMLIETLPKTENLKRADLEIVGMPKVGLNEQCMKEKANAYLSSDFLRRKLTDKPYSKIIQYYPETDRLEVVGKRIHKHAIPIIRDSDVELSVISSVSYMEQLNFPDYFFQINDITFKTDDKPLQPLNFNLKFNTQPYESQTLLVFRIKNNGKKPICCSWKKIKPKGFAFMPPIISPFQFKTKTFQLTFDETKIIENTFSPLRQMKYDEQWSFIIKPSIPNEEHDITLRLSGDCCIPNDFLDEIFDEIIKRVFSRGARRKIFDIPVLSECELFDILNPGFKCNDEDLWRFKQIFRLFKNKSHPSTWDLKLQTLKLLIEGCRNFSKRQQGLNDFLRIIREMRLRNSFCDLNIKIQIARTVIISTLDKWEAKAIQIVNSIARTEIDVLVIRMPNIIDKVNECETSKDKRRVIQYEALYSQMHCHFCALIDEIEFFIENCLLLEQHV